MKFVLKEYITLLKEDKELDALMIDLLFSINIIPISKPQKGRQYGVDISAVGIDPEDGKKKLFLIAVKQGNITRSNWDSGPVSVRQTLNEILDVYIPTILTKAQKSLPKKIILCTNGELEQTALVNWNSFINKHGERGATEFEFWGIDKISFLVDQHLIPEKLFPEELKTLFRKTLAFIDLPDYDMKHYYEAIENLFSKSHKSKKDIIKILRIVRVCFGVIIKWSVDIQNIKPALIASERTLLSTWNWLRKNNLLEENYAWDEYHILHQMKIKLGRDYFNKVREHFYVKHGLFQSGNQLEYSLTVWEHIGLLSSIALTEISEAEIYAEVQTEYSQTCYSNVNEYATALKGLIQYNPPSNYPEYDEHLIEISLALIVLFKSKEHEFASNWLRGIVSGLNDFYKIKKFIPLFRTDYEKLANIHMGNDISKPESSMLIPILMEWCVILNQLQSYELIKILVKENYPNVNLQIWFPDETSEDLLYHSDMSKRSGDTKCSIELYENMEEYRKEIIEERAMFFKEKDFSFFGTPFYYLGYLSSRHFRSNLFPIYWRQWVKLESTLLEL